MSYDLLRGTLTGLFLYVERVKYRPKLDELQRQGEEEEYITSGLLAFTC